MKCYNCKAELPETASFCYKCGSPQKFTTLVKKSLENDQKSTEQLYLMTYNNVYQTICAVARLDEDTVFDLIQNTYVKAFRNLSQLSEPEAFRGWIKVIARNLTIDYLRKKKVIVFSQMVSVDSDEMIEFEDDKTEHLPEVVMDKNETARLLGEILDSLSEEQRIAVTMYYFEELSVKEIAEILKASEGTIKSRLNYGRKKIEEGVKALEKKGTKLYGLAPIPFLLFLFRGQEAYAAELPNAMVLQAVQNSLTVGVAGSSSSTGASSAISKKTAGTIGTETVKTTAKAVGKETIKTTVGAAGKAAIVKVVAAVATVAVVGTGAVGIASMNKAKNNINSQETELSTVVSELETEDFDYGTIDQYVVALREEHISYDSYDYYLKVPEILLDSEDARQCNREIQDKFMPEFDYAYEAQSKEADYGLRGMDYKAWIYEGTIVVWMSSTTAWVYTDYEVYMFDIETGERLDNDAVAAQFGLDNNYRENIKQTLASECLKLAKEGGYSEEGYYLPIYEQTISSENIDQSVLFIDQDGNLMMACTMYVPSGAGHYEYIFPVIY